ncbi:hypothetical protein Sango_0452200 [Sesamum angolense]|uniref:RIN4 pathogenic type III effector avirulence factor Avr cleavage site domain-containing protein n=1 Tax=Sesamum angolense TaxID=2727404 RepID=A0AAE1XB78_9LAMI|nr:hypothetical protein Sango_0452200 [Sesamum angolense]
MDEFNWRRRHVPAFGSWDCDYDTPFTQCFESARQAGIVRYSYSEDRDLYVAGDLYENDVVTPAMIVVPRHRGKVGYAKEKEGKKDGWVVCDYDCELKAPPSPVSTLPAPPQDDRKLSMKICTRSPRISSIPTAKGREHGVSFQAACAQLVALELW